MIGGWKSGVSGWMQARAICRDCIPFYPPMKKSALRDFVSLTTAMLSLPLADVFGFC